MLKREKVIQELIANGYDENLVAELPKLFIEDYLEKKKEDLSEALDIFIDKVQSGDTMGDYYNKDKNIYFANIQKMSKNDFKLNTCDGLFYNFKSHITEEFLNIVKRRPLRNILLNAGVLELEDDYQKYHKEIVGSPVDYIDLCRVFCISYYPQKHNYTFQTIYIRLNDFLTLMESKGIKKEDIINGSCISDSISDEEIFINYDAIMAIGNSQEYVPKMKPENN